MEEQTDIFAVSLYSVPEIGYTRQAYNRTVANAIAHSPGTNGSASVRAIPWISLGCGYRRQFDTYEAYDLNWNYDYIYSWQLGAELNGRPTKTMGPASILSPWRHADHVVFYPSVFDQRTSNVTEATGGRSPWHAGLHHFAAYCMGAAGTNWGDQSQAPIQP